MRCSECVRLTSERDRRHRAFLTVQKLLDDADTDILIAKGTELRTLVHDALMELNFAQTELTHHRDHHESVKSMGFGGSG